MKERKKKKNQVTAKVLHTMHSENLKEHFISTSQYNNIRAFKKENILMIKTIHKHS